MPEVLSVTEIDEQHVALLPARTVMSLFTTGPGDGAGAGAGGIGINVLSGIGVLGTGSGDAADAIGGAGRSANG